MSADRKSRAGKTRVPNNLYTAVLVLAFCVVLATAALVAFKCYIQYDTVFSIP